jgi:hypothetical protein
MPSETVYLDDETYSYAIETKDDGQSIGKRLQELVKAGKEYEQDG